MPHPKEAEIVQLVFNLSERGDSGIPYGVKRIAEYLNERGILRRGNRWTHTNVHVVLTNKVSIGEYSWGNRRSRPSPDNAPIVSKIPRIISDEQFYRVQRGLAERSPIKHGKDGAPQATPVTLGKRAIRSKILLSGLMKCRECGANMAISTTNSGQYRYYRCQTKIKTSVKLCSCPNLPLKPTDQAILDAVKKRFLDSDHIDSLLRGLSENLAASSKNVSKQIGKLKLQRSKVSAGLTILYDQIAEGQLTINEVLSKSLDCVFQTKPATDSRGKLPPIPDECCH